MQLSKHDLLEHVRWLRHAVAGAKGQLLIAGDSLQALIRRGDDHVVLHPRFVTEVDGAMVFTPQVDGHGGRFGGWLPYVAKPWPLDLDRAVFKRILASSGVGFAAEVTSDSTDPSATPVVVKGASTSRRAFLEGPFRSVHERPLRHGSGEYYERFVDGEPLEAWYWNGALVCAELMKRPTVTGDGASTLRDLVLARASFSAPRAAGAEEALVARCDRYLAYLGTSVTAVVPRGERRAVDFRHRSILAIPSDVQVIALASAPNHGWVAELRSAGRALHAAFPAAARSDTLFAIEAVLDESQRIRVLGLNWMTEAHPLAYPAIVGSIVPTLPVAAVDPDARTGALQRGASDRG